MIKLQRDFSNTKMIEIILTNINKNLLLNKD